LTKHGDLALPHSTDVGFSQSRKTTARSQERYQE
jgi:hypothetical protein